MLLRLLHDGGFVQKGTKEVRGKEVKKQALVSAHAPLRFGFRPVRYTGEQSVSRVAGGPDRHGLFRRSIMHYGGAGGLTARVQHASSVGEVFPPELNGHTLLVETNNYPHYYPKMHINEATSHTRCSLFGSIPRFVQRSENRVGNHPLFNSGVVRVQLRGEGDTPSAYKGGDRVSFRTLSGCNFATALVYLILT